MGRKKKTETKVEAVVETEAKVEEAKATPAVNSVLLNAKKILVDQYRNPEKRNFHWDIMKNWMVDRNGELTEAGKAIVAEVEAAEAAEASEEK